MNNEQAHDPTVTLRLELGRVTDQRNAYEAALRKEVLVVIKDALSDNSRLVAENARLRAAGTIGCMGVEVDDLRKENAFLKSEVERLKESNECLDKMHEKEMERSAYLCEEFNRTTAWGRGLESDLSHARVEISFLKSEVERLKNNCAYLDQKLDEEIERSASFAGEISRLTDAITAGAITPDAREVQS